MDHCEGSGVSLGRPARGRLSPKKKKKEREKEREFIKARYCGTTGGVHRHVLSCWLEPLPQGATESLYRNFW